MHRLLRIGMGVVVILLILSMILPWWSLTVTSTGDSGTAILRLDPIAAFRYSPPEMALFLTYFTGGVPPAIIGVPLAILFWLTLLIVIFLAIFSLSKGIGWGSVGAALIGPFLFLILLSIFSTFSGVSWFVGNATEVIESTTYTFAWHVELGWLCALFAGIITLIIRIFRYRFK